MAERLGFETRAIKGDMTLFDLPDLTFPLWLMCSRKGSCSTTMWWQARIKEHIHIADPDPGVKPRFPRERFAQEWTGSVFFMAPSPGYKPHKEKKQGLLSFLPILFKQRGITNIVLATLLVTLINIVRPYYLQSIIDSYVPTRCARHWVLSPLGWSSSIFSNKFVLCPGVSPTDPWATLIDWRDFVLSSMFFTCRCPFSRQ